jgi:hypothetical protein
MPFSKDGKGVKDPKAYAAVIKRAVESPKKKKGKR